MPRPRPTPLYHFTHIDHLATIITQGLRCDNLARENLLQVEVGQPGIKEQRRRRWVMCGKGGTVGDYVPFYFAPRSPTLSAIVKGRVRDYDGGQDPLVYLETTVERLVELQLRPVFTDRNAAQRIVRFTNDPQDLEELVDWDLMKARMWKNTDEDKDRRDRRMAECLVHHRVPWAAFSGITARTETTAQQARLVLGQVGVQCGVTVSPGWYF